MEVRFMVLTMLLCLLMSADVLAADLTANYTVTYNGTSFQVNGQGAYATFSEALTACSGDGTQVIQLGTAATPLVLSTSTTGTNLITATYTGWVDFSIAPAADNYGFKIPGEATFEDIEIANSSAPSGPRAPAARSIMVFTVKGMGGTIISLSPGEPFPTAVVVPATTTRRLFISVPKSPRQHLI